MPSLTATRVQPAPRLRGGVRPPGDKSISHRYAMLAALAEGESTLSGFAPGADCASTLRCLEDLGTIVHRSPGTVSLIGRGLRGLRSPAGPLDTGNSGTTMRLLAGLLAGQPFTATLTGDDSLRRRPMRRVIDPLTRMGARIDAPGDRAPLTIAGGGLHGITFEPTVPSAQVKSALLLAGLFARGETQVVEPAQTRDHTERAFEAFGIPVTRDGLAITVHAASMVSPRPLTIPGDLSSAVFWMVAAAGLPGSEIDIEGVGLNPTRTAVLDVLRRFGAEIHVDEDHVTAGEPIGRIRVRGGTLRPVSLDEREVPGVIDEIPALAALAALGSSLVVRGAAELRVKESDRISALAAGLRTLGAAVDEYPDGFQVQAAALTGGTVDACGDHRLAMAFAIAALGASGPTDILGADSVGISYPGFFETLDELRA
ncbi:MAG TPA: 3-phosphoshikimate 1-carboxyvinyltransferase [Vicinamibacterales bacterium]